MLGRTPGLMGRLLAAEDCHSVLVFGPTGSSKTSALVIPAVLEWTGPLLATSVKPDLLRATMAHRSRLGQVLVIDPLGASGVKAARWSPLASCSTWAGAQQMAVMLANAIEQTPTEEQRPEHRFWKTMGTKFLAPTLYAAATKGLGMAEVLHWLDSREDQEVNDILAAAGVPAAVDAWESSQYRTDRAVDSLYATAEEVLADYGNQRVAASTDGHDLDLDSFLAGNHTIYLYAPAHQQRLSDRCSRRSPSRWSPPPKRKPPSAPVGCCRRGWACFWMRRATAPPCPTWTCWPPPHAARASSWSQSGMTRASSKPGMGPRRRPS
jgi:type IV secretion system protein VirD4